MKFLVVSAVDLPVSGSDAVARALELVRGTHSDIVALVPVHVVDRGRTLLIDIQTRMKRAAAAKKSNEVRDYLIEYAEIAARLLVTYGIKGLET